MSVPQGLASTLLLTAGFLLTGCQRGAEPPATTAELPGPAGAVTPSPETGTIPTAGDGADPPEGVLRAYVWNCDDGRTLHMKNLYREDAITLELHEGPRKLPHVPAASGAKYADETLTFWTKGEEALFERKGQAGVNCRQDRARSLAADARARGVRLRGFGNEPGWSVEIGPGDRVTWVTGYGEDRYEFESAEEPRDDGGTAYVGTADGGAIRVTVTPESCHDDMSGEAFTHRVMIEYEGRTYRGCGGTG